MSSLYQRAGEVFFAALALPISDRDGFVAGACRDDQELLSEVSSLLLFHEAEETGGPAEPGDPSTATEELFSAGDMFADRYRMITCIGRGGMGAVWRADDVILETPVALKVIRSASPSARRRILQEVRLARQITHASVCRVFDVGEAGDIVFFSMEFVRGQDLAALLKHTGRLPSERVVLIAHQLCAGLAAAHAQGVLHRDLKPANVLIDLDGRVRITDFGIAVTRDDTAPHTMIGTPGYMAPEQLIPGAQLSDQTDVYALGLVLYELVTGQPHHLWRPANPSHPSLPAPDIDPQLERVILKAISRDSRDRPATAREMASALPAIDGAEIAVERQGSRCVALRGGRHGSRSQW